MPTPQTIDTKPVTSVKKIIPNPIEDKGLKIINAAIELVKRKNYDSAQELLERYLSSNDDNRAQLNLALIYLKKNQQNSAKELLLSILKNDNNNEIALEHLAIIARQEGQFKRAKTLYLRALKNSDKASIHLNFAILLDLYLNDLNLALKHYNAYLESELATQDNIELEKWIADLNIRIKRGN